jgi:predicted nucleotidyltransferase
MGRTPGDIEDELKQLLGVEVDVIDETSLRGRTRRRQREARENYHESSKID